MPRDLIFGRARKPAPSGGNDPSFFDAVEQALNAILSKIEKIDLRGTGRDGRDGLFPIRARITDGSLSFDMSNGTEFVIGDVRGPQGPQGGLGEPGVMGERGLEGAAGLPGPRGEKGSRGLRGERGEIGERGLRGERGERGLRGEIGPEVEIEMSEPIPMTEDQMGRLTFRAVRIGKLVLHVVEPEGD